MKSGSRVQAMTVNVGVTQYAGLKVSFYGTTELVVVNRDPDTHEEQSRASIYLNPQQLLEFAQALTQVASEQLQEQTEFWDVDHWGTEGVQKWQAKNKAAKLNK